MPRAPRDDAYVRVWQYDIVPARRAEFERVYGPAGEWVRLFRRAAGHRRTELLRDQARPLRYVTLDVWDSQEAWQAFRARFAADYEDLDARCAALTRRERELGQFVAVSPREREAPRA